MTEPPSGAQAPATARLGADTIDLIPLAREICRRYRAEYPDEQDRYGDAGVAWCVHDNQHILNWAIAELNGFAKLADQLAWLARVLEARDFPLDRMARNLEIGAKVVEDERLAGALAAGARFVRSRPSFL